MKIALLLFILLIIYIMSYIFCRCERIEINTQNYGLASVYKKNSEHLLHITQIEKSLFYPCIYFEAVCIKGVKAEQVGFIGMEYPLVY